MDAKDKEYLEAMKVFDEAHGVYHDSDDAPLNDAGRIVQKAIDDACVDKNATIRLMTNSLVTILDDPNITLPPGVGGLLDAIISTGRESLDANKKGGD